MKHQVLKLIQEKKIKIGTTQEELLSLLGEPTDKSRGTRRYPEPLIWKYEDIEFAWTSTKTLGLVMEVREPDHHETLLR